MEDISEKPDILENLNSLKEESLNIFLIFSGVVTFLGLLWFAANLNSRLFLWPAFIALVISVTSLLFSFQFRNKALVLAQRVYVWGFFLSVFFGTLTINDANAIYLLIIPLVFTSVMLEQMEILRMTLIASLLAVVFHMLFEFGKLNLSYSQLWSASILGGLLRGLGLAQILLPIIVFGLSAVALWLSSRNLLVAMAWIYQGYEHARENEQIAREKQAESRRVLAELDTAMYRLERANYLYAVAQSRSEEAKRQKQQFLQNISHELRTPLNIIIGFIGLMAQSPEDYGGNLPPRYLRDLSIVYRNATHLLSLIDDVLDLSRIEAAKMVLVPEEVDPAELVRDAVETCRSLIESRGLELKIEINGEIPHIWVDPVRIRQVLYNLLNNAARFTEQGFVQVRLRKGKGHVIFSVADTGPGIPEKSIGNIFNEFHQVDGSTRRRYEGAGLGLAISKRFIELHGGTISVKSKEGAGSVFSFTIPLTATQSEVAGLEYPGEDSEREYLDHFRSGEQPVLLVVTKSSSAATLISRYVHGCRKIFVSSLEQAEHVAEELIPQTILFDSSYGKVESERFRRNWRQFDIPIICCPLPPDNPLIEDLSIDGYLVAPITQSRFEDALLPFNRNVERIVVIDDDRDMIRLITRILEQILPRSDIFGTDSGNEGLVVISQKIPNLVILNTNIKDMEIQKLVTRIRSVDEWRNIRIVIVSDQDEPEHNSNLLGTFSVDRATGLSLSELSRWVESIVDVSMQLGSINKITRMDEFSPAETVDNSYLISRSDNS